MENQDVRNKTMHNDNRRKFKSSATSAVGASLFGMPGIVLGRLTNRIRWRSLGWRTRTEPRPGDPPIGKC